MPIRDQRAPLNYGETMDQQCQIPRIDFHWPSLRSNPKMLTAIEQALFRILFSNQEDQKVAKARFSCQIEGQVSLNLALQFPMIFYLS